MAHLSHGGVVSLVGVQFVLQQLGQGGVVLVLPGTTRTTPGDMSTLKTFNRTMDKSVLERRENRWSWKIMKGHKGPYVTTTCDSD